MNLKITSLLHRVFASYLRAVAAGLSTLAVGHATDAFHSSIGPQVLAVVLGSLIAPGLVFLTEAADIVDPPQ